MDTLEIVGRRQIRFRNTIPKPLRRPVGRALGYVRRLRTWTEVARKVRGETADDQAILRRALLRSPVTALRSLDKWVDPHVDKDCRVVTSFGTFDVRAYSDDLYHTLPGRERGIAEAIRRLNPGDIFVDAGANIGVYTVFAAKRGAKVIAVEMMPQTAAILKKHVRTNGCDDVHVVEAALSDAGGKIVTATVEPGKYGSASIATIPKSEAVAVRTTTFNDILNDVPRVHLLKMDLEGAESDAIKALPTAKVDAVIFEDWGTSDVAQFFRASDFTVTQLDKRNWLARRERE